MDPVVLDQFEITSMTIADGMVTVTANGSLTVGAWHPADELTFSIFDATCQIDLDCFDVVPDSIAELMAELGPNTEWEIPDLGGDDID